MDSSRTTDRSHRLLARICYSLLRGGRDAGIDTKHLTTFKSCLLKLSVAFALLNRVSRGRVVNVLSTLADLRWFDQIFYFAIGGIMPLSRCRAHILLSQTKGPLGQTQV